MKPVPYNNHPGRPEGGFHIISTRQLCAAWTAYRLGLLGGFLPLRVYLALHEIAEQRAAAARRRPLAGAASGPTVLAIAPTLAVVERLVGGASGRYLRRSVRRLSAVGLVQREGNGVVLVDDPFATASPSLQVSADAMLSRIHSSPRVRERPLAVPRRLLRYLARPGCPAVAATLLGHALRCLWRQGEEHHLVGSCSAGFIADVFGVHVRTVKTARRFLQAAGWLRSLPAPRWHVQRFGGRWAITPPNGRRTITLPATTGTESPLPPAVSGTESPPPGSKRSLPSEVQQPEPALRRGLVSARGGKHGFNPDLRHVQAGDLRDDGRLSHLLRQAVAQGRLSNSEADRLRGFAAAEHALRVGTHNPAGLFAWLLRRRCWRFIAAVDEDRARVRLRRQERPRVTERPQSPASGDSIAALVGRTASALSLTSRLERAKARTASASPLKNAAVDLSPQHAASSVMACMASKTNSTLSASTPRNTAVSSVSVMVGKNRESMPGACHNLRGESPGFCETIGKAQRIRRESSSDSTAAA